MRPVTGTMPLPSNLPAPSPDRFLSGQVTPDKRLPVIDRQRVDPQMREAAEGMEAMFLDFMMKTMRETVPKSEYSLDSPASRIYTSMLDNEMTQKAVKAGGVGLAEQIIAFMSAPAVAVNESHRYNLSGEQEALPGAQAVDQVSAHTKE